eukprot:scaffold129528_cov60-Phaeocystis_antarctica.AAC.2
MSSFVRAAGYYIAYSQLAGKYGRTRSSLAPSASASRLSPRRRDVHVRVLDARALDRGAALRESGDEAADLGLGLGLGLGSGLGLWLGLGLGSGLGRR